MLVQLQAGCAGSLMRTTMRFTDNQFRLKNRRGAAAMLAMLFLILFATLAVGFYASTDTAVQVSANDLRISRSLLAADSGMDLVRYQLERVTIPPGTPSANVVDELYEDLVTSLEGT